MCGNESTVRIERVGNGYTVDAYTPGGKDKPGTHKRSVATSPEHVIRTVEEHLKRGTAIKGKSSSPGRRSKGARMHKGAALKR